MFTRKALATVLNVSYTSGRQPLLYSSYCTANLSRLYFLLFHCTVFSKHLYLVLILYCYFLTWTLYCYSLAFAGTLPRAGWGIQTPRSQRPSTRPWWPSWTAVTPASLWSACCWLFYLNFRLWAITEAVFYFIMIVSRASLFVCSNCKTLFN